MIVVKLALGEYVTDQDLIDDLTQICEDEHYACDRRCPIFVLNEGKVPNELKTDSGCDCFKDGKKMLRFIRERKSR